MTEILLSILLGAVAGAIDVVPMIKTSPKFASVLVFAQWIFLGLIIPFVGWAIAPWLKGLVLGTLGMVPIMILVFPRNPKKIPGIAIFGAVLGALIGYCGTFIVH